MPSEYDLPHFDISDRLTHNTYKARTNSRGGGSAPRIREDHGQALIDQLQVAFTSAQAQVLPIDGLTRAAGAYYEVDLQKGAPPSKLERKRDHIQSGATKVQPETYDTTTVVFIPDEAVPVLRAIFEDYRSGPLRESDAPPNKSYVEPINAIRRARLEAFWTDPLSLLPVRPSSVWWEVWCHKGLETEVSNTFTRLECRLAAEDQWLQFPDLTVLFVFARRVDIEMALIATNGIAELRRGTDTPHFFVAEQADNQHAWVDDYAARVRWPGLNVPRVCVLDKGVNRAHALLEPALSVADLLTVDANWVPTDSIEEPHGTEMAGLALHGDLFAVLQDQRELRLTHRLESVRILPADGFPPNDLTKLGSITQSAVSLAEIQNPAQRRVFCLAVTNEDISGERATTWSAIIDRTAAGLMAGDDETAPKRLFFISAGNRPAHIEASRYLPLDQYPIEDPAQAWNAITVGGYTEKTVIAEPSLRDFVAHADAGGVSPFSRNSMSWRQSKTPIKPEIVMEAGNRAQSADGRTLVNCPSLELLTTGSEVDRAPLVNFAATSAATALASRMAARLQADHPDYWPETIRALMVHSAQWTPAMEQLLNDNPAQRDRLKLVRQFGYGVPNYERARSSATNDLAIIVQQDIQPYGRRESGGVGFHDCHYFDLPWPKALLESRALADQIFELKVTLSYFVAPNPGRAAAVDPQRYQSYGLRFDLKRPGESVRAFKHRVNDDEPAPLGRITTADTGWVLGANSIAAGSLHCDVWRGSGARLAARDMICVKPVSGWWKERRTESVFAQRARYALVATLSAPSQDIDLYTPILTSILQPVQIDIPTR
ncbi:S8 family peptidase [Asticcacaulis sp. AND118]|uniref:S8 family peptidase n=1 Tax=Asticcacaulis sp. AND118 TaxID=2840468 RepID=UPI001CFF55B4|nr:S8 family peptidase [Asticcacaulis sp. AND118]UDF05612.1 S8 family peptidase [Asticcacaulis sp. AND118]